MSKAIFSGANNLHVSSNCYENQNFKFNLIFQFVEMDELRGGEWQEVSRWIKFEEDLLEGAERWGRPHISSLTFHSVINLGLVLEQSKFIV